MRIGRRIKVEFLASIVWLACFAVDGGAATRNPAETGVTKTANTTDQWECRMDAKESRQITFGARIFLITSAGGERLGTGFALGTPETVVTAAHVVKGQGKEVLVIRSLPWGERVATPEDVLRHPYADVAVIKLKQGIWPDGERYQLGVPPQGQPWFNQGTEVGAYGYPAIERDIILGRYMKGHIQALVEVRNQDYQHKGMELGFPAFPGLSGAPVFLDDMYYHRTGRDHAIGVVTESLVVEETRWARAVSLWDLQDWLGEINPCLGPGMVAPPS